MSARSLLVLPAAALLLASCSQGALPQSPLLKWLERPSGRIAFIGEDGNVRTVDQGGGNSKDVTTDAAVAESGPSFFYQFPAWSPDAKSLAFVGVRRTKTEVLDAGVWTSAGGAAARPIYRVSDGTVPRYLSWAPDSSRLVFASGTGGDRQQLDAIEARGGTVRVLESGTGFAWRWDRRGARLAVHSIDITPETGSERVSILDPAGTAEARQLAQVPGDFEAPAWSTDGRGVIMTVSGASGSTLYLADSGGAPGRALAPVDGATTFDLSPDGRRLAWSARPAGGGEDSRALYVLDLGVGAGSATAAAVPSSPRPLSGDDYVAAFWWSPDGSRIAYFVPSSTDLSVTLKVLTVKTGSVRTVTTFTPSAYFFALLTQFGQYAESVRLWSPNGKYLLYCDAQDGGFGIMVAYADQPIAPRKVAEGIMATWSPR